MLRLLKDISIVPRGLRHKTIIAFSLMSLIPILVCVWIVAIYIFPNIKVFSGLTIGNISFILLISAVISTLGFYIIKEMINPVIKMAEDAKIIAEGGVIKGMDTGREDELGNLSKSLNTMTQKIKENMDELKAYGEKTKLINLEINKKVLALSSLLQIGNMISSSKELAAILNFITGEVSNIENDSASLLMLMDEDSKEYVTASSCNIEEGRISGLKLKQSEVSFDILAKKLGLKNIVAMPVTGAGKTYGILVVGNNETGFVFADDEKELLKVFAKQIAIALENNILVKKSKELAVKDEVTCLYNYNYMKARLDEEIKRALVYQRPCGYLLVDVDNFKDFYAVHGATKSEAFLREIGVVLQGSVLETDKVGRLRDDKFAIILPEKNKRQAAHIAEEIRKKIEGWAGKTGDSDRRLTVSIGVSENPLDGSTADELMEKADRFVRSAKSLGKNRVVV